ncbi:hypothetical protein [Ferruginibacter sp. HRS2-29]|uniref:hypothetical protein n=1 Tax=Ferruginibacter sp. HRS2-29 TaxID=2487334 RepID=UPI0020CE9EAA|nr:hypothetical protein [Ferruginibacter sp. HRS2-29]MCP9751332.1 hypothetical protein [Ferruginibacter sp. HRS2-29]
MEKYTIEIASVPDREKVVAEIWYLNIMLAEINQENENLQIELFDSAERIINLEDFLIVLNDAKLKLLLD